MVTPEEIFKFHNKHIEAGIHAYQGWDHCYDAFHKLENREALSLHLAACMGSYGMNRGTSLVRLSNYKIHRGAVDILLKYRIDLGDISFDHFSENAIKKTRMDIMNLYKELKEFYGAQRKKIIKDNIGQTGNATATLITKIMMCSLGCAPAYDRMFLLGLKEEKLTQRFGQKSLNQVMEFCNKNQQEIHKCQTHMKTPNGHSYPIMRIIDIHFWLQGRN